MTYPRDYRQERTYGCSGTGVIITLVLVVAIMIVVVALTAPAAVSSYVVSYEWTPEFLAALPYLTITMVVLLMFLGASWIHRHLPQVGSEGQQTPEEYL